MDRQSLHKATQVNEGDLSPLDPSVRPRKLHKASGTSPVNADRSYLLIDHYRAMSHNWAMGMGVTNAYPGFYSPLESGFYPPHFQMQQLYGDVRKPYEENLAMAGTTDILQSSHVGQIPQEAQNIEEVGGTNTLKLENFDNWLDDGVIEDTPPQQKRLTGDSNAGIVASRQKVKNETKNIPKNYGKAMITFIIARTQWIKDQFEEDVTLDLMDELKIRKDMINSIVHLKELWTNSKFSREFRILSNLFLRKHSYSYIFNSRVSNYATHIKYKYKLQDALKAPQEFSSIKEY